MHIKTDKDGFSTLLSLLPPQELETSAMQSFRAKDTDTSAMFFALADVGLKIAKGMLSQKKKISVTNTEACFILKWIAITEKQHAWDFYIQNVLRTVNISLHHQLTNYQYKF